MSTRSLGRLIVELAAEIGQYRRDWEQAAQTTQDGAARVERATRGMDAASGALRETLVRQTGAFGEAAAGAAEFGGAAATATGVSTGLAVAGGALVAALGAVAYAAHQGAKEQKALNDSLVLTGNYAGLVTGQLDQMAVRTAAAIGGTVNASRQVLAGLTASGRFTVEAMGEVAQAVQLVARYSGQTNEQVLRDFAGMADGVAKWAAKHNEAYHFLDLATYRYIKQLEEQGQKQDAMRVTSEALSRHLGGDLTQNLGVIERSWLAVQRAASNAWAAMKEVGKPETTQDIFAKNSEYLERAKKGWMRNSPQLDELLRGQNFELFRRMEREQRLAGDRSAEAQATEAATKAEEAWGKVIDRNRTRAEQMGEAIRQMRAAGAASGRTEAEMAEQERRIRDSFAEKKQRKADPYDSLLKSAKERAATLQLELDGTVKLTEAEKLRAKYMADLANGYIQYNEVKDRAYMATLAEMDASEKAGRAREKEAKETEAAAKALDKKIEAAGKSAEEAQEAAAREQEHAAAIGLSKVQVAELSAKKLEDAAASKERQAVVAQDIDLSGAWSEALRREAAALRERADATRLRAQRETQQDQAKEALRTIREMDDTARRVFSDMASRGEDAFKAIGRAAKAQLYDFLYQMTARPFVIQVGMAMTGQSSGAISQAMGGSGFNIAGLFGGGGGNGGIGSTLFNGSGMWGSGGLINGISNGASALGFTNFAAGLSGAGGSFASSVGAGLATDAIGATVMEGAAAATLGSAGATAGSMAAAAIPYIGWAIAIASLLSSSGAFKGETRSGGSYRFAPGSGVSLAHGPSGGELDGGNVRNSIVATTASINAMLRDLGSSAQLTEFHAGLESSKKGRGGVMSGGSLSTGRAFGESGSGSNYDGTYYERTSTQSPDDATAIANFAEDLKQATLQALQAADVPGILGAYLKSLGDVENLHGAELDAAVNRIQKALGEKVKLEQEIEALTTGPEEALRKAREAEREALDESNRAMLDRVYALREERAASEALQASLSQAIEKAKNDSKAWAQFMAGVSSNVRGYLDRLNAGPAGMLAPEQQLANARSQFDRQLQLAQMGDREALGNITGYADQLIAAQVAWTASGPQTAATIADIKSKLENLPDLESAEEYLARVIKESSEAEISAVKGAGDNIWNGLWGSAGMLSTKFDTLDTSLDGLLSFDEMKTALGPLADDDTLRALIERVDQNGDGQISKLEAIRASVYDSTARQTGTLVTAIVAGETAAQTGTSPAAQLSRDAILAQRYAAGQITQMTEGSGENMGLYLYDTIDGRRLSSAEEALLYGWTGPSYAVGTSYVPHDQIAKIHEGEAVLTPEQAADWRGGGGAAAEIRALRQEVVGLRNALVSYARQDLDNGGAIARSLVGAEDNRRLAKVS